MLPQVSLGSLFVATKLPLYDYSTVLVGTYTRMYYKHCIMIDDDEGPEEIPPPYLWSAVLYAWRKVFQSALI